MPKLSNSCRKFHPALGFFPVFLQENQIVRRALQDKLINPFTDFGFKKLFCSEPKRIGAAFQTYPGFE
jgi:hypothetical protein